MGVTLFHCIGGMYGMCYMCCAWLLRAYIRTHIHRIIKPRKYVRAYHENSAHATLLHTVIS